MRIIDRASVFLSRDIWMTGVDRASRARRFWYAMVRVGYMTVDGFIKDLCATRASALTFTSLMAFVPVLALAFAILRGLGWSGERLEALILDKATILSADAIRLIVSYIDNINFTGLGVFGGAFLFVTFVSVITSVETAFNAIWGNAPARTFGRRVTDYFGVLTVAPVLLVVATSLTAAVQSNAVVQWLSGIWGLGLAIEYTFAYAVYGVVWVLFAFLYAFVPNTRVRLVPALVGGVLAGTVWQLTQWGYIRFQIGMAKYNAIYGALAQLPLLMAWMYISWVVVLVGAELAYALQTVHVYGRERRAATKAAQAFHDWVAMAVGIELARASAGKVAPPSADDLGHLLDVPLRTVREALAALEQAGLAHVGGPHASCYYLSLAPEHVPVTRVLEAVHGRLPAEDGKVVTAEAGHSARALLEEFDAAAEAAFGRRTLKDVMGAGPRPEPATSAPQPLEPVGRADFGTDRKGRRTGEV